MKTRTLSLMHLVAADYIDEIECTDGICQQQA